MTRTWKRPTCSYPVDYSYAEGDDYCGRPACINKNGYWYCTEHENSYTVEESWGAEL